MELMEFEKQAIMKLLSNQLTPEFLETWVSNLEVINRDFNGYGYYLRVREQSNNSLGKSIKPDCQKLVQGWYKENNDNHHIGFIFWVNEDGVHSLECHPYDDKPIQQSILQAQVLIQ